MPDLLPLGQRLHDFSGQDALRLPDFSLPAAWLDGRSPWQPAVVPALDLKADDSSQTGDLATPGALDALSPATQVSTWIVAQQTQGPTWNLLQWRDYMESRTVKPVDPSAKATRRASVSSLDDEADSHAALKRYEL